MEKPRDEEQLKNLVQSWVAAERESDATALDRLLADDFLCVGPLGFVLDKAQYLQSRRSGDLKHQAYTWEYLSVRLYQEAAIVVGTQTQQSTYQERDASGQFRVTQVAVWQDGHWRIAHLQFSRITQPPPARP